MIPTQTGTGPVTDGSVNPVPESCPPREAVLVPNCSPIFTFLLPRYLLLTLSLLSLLQNGSQNRPRLQFPPAGRSSRPARRSCPLLPAAAAAPCAPLLLLPSLRLLLPHPGPGACRRPLVAGDGGTSSAVLQGDGLTGDQWTRIGQMIVTYGSFLVLVL